MLTKREENLLKVIKSVGGIVSAKEIMSLVFLQKNIFNIEDNETYEFYYWFSSPHNIQVFSDVRTLEEKGFLEVGGGLFFKPYISLLNKTIKELDIDQKEYLKKIKAKISKNEENFTLKIKDLFNLSQYKNGSLISNSKITKEELLDNLN